MTEQHNFSNPLGAYKGSRLDKFCALAGAFFPTALIMGNTAFEAAITLVGLIWIIRCIVTRYNPLQELRKHPLFLPWLAWYACIVVSLLYNGPGHKGWAHDIIIIRFPLFAFALIDISKRLPVAGYLVFGLAAGILWTAINTLSAYSIGFDFLGKPLATYQSKLNMTGRIAGLAAYAFPFFAGCSLLNNKSLPRERFLFAAIGIIALVFVFLCNIRTTVVASLGGLVVGLVYYVKKRFSFRFAGLFVGVLFFVFLIGLIITKPWEDDRLYFLSLYDRFFIWKVVWGIWLDHPLLGVGISAFQDSYKAVAPYMTINIKVPEGILFDWAREATHSHNLFLMLLSCTGFLGLLAFCWLFANAVRQIIKNETFYHAGLISWPIVFFIIGLIGYNIYHSWYQALFAYFMVLIGSEQKSMPRNTTT